MLGSLIPSSRFLIDRLLSRVDWNRAKTIVEYGPGVGTITAHILSRMSPDARLVVFEMNEDFVNYLARTFPDPRLHVVHGSAENVQRELDRLKSRWRRLHHLRNSLYHDAGGIARKDHARIA